MFQWTKKKTRTVIRPYLQGRRKTKRDQNQSRKSMQMRIVVNYSSVSDLRTPTLSRFDQGSSYLIYSLKITMAYVVHSEYRMKSRTNKLLPKWIFLLDITKLRLFWFVFHILDYCIREVNKCRVCAQFCKHRALCKTRALCADHMNEFMKFKPNIYEVSTYFVFIQFSINLYLTGEKVRGRCDGQKGFGTYSRVQEAQTSE